MISWQLNFKYLQNGQFLFSIFTIWYHKLNVHFWILKFPTISLQVAHRSQSQWHKYTHEKLYEFFKLAKLRLLLHIFKMIAAYSASEYPHINTILRVNWLLTTHNNVVYPVQISDAVYPFQTCSDLLYWLVQHSL